MHSSTIRARGALLVLCVTLAACAGARRDASTPDTRHPTPGIRVLVYNIHAGLDANGASNLDSVAALVRAMAADLVLLQEVDSVVRRSGGVDQPTTLAERTGMHVAFGSTLPYQGGQYGIAVLSRWPIVRHELVPLAVTPPQPRVGGAYEPRGALHVLVDAPGGALHVINTHLDASGDDRVRRQEADSVLAIAHRLGAGGEPVLVGGDFNSTPESVVQQRIRDGGLRDLWASCGAGDGLSFPASGPVKRIDYLYGTGAAACRRAEVLQSRASDHRAVLFELDGRGGARAGSR
jgi:endonuclease/exonuclease/phosphatase family metal-dependent hydrolase